MDCSVALILPRMARDISLNVHSGIEKRKRILGGHYRAGAGDEHSAVAPTNEEGLNEILELQNLDDILDELARFP